MMKCRKVKNLFSPWLDGELKPVEAGEFQQHIAGCASCRAELAAWQEISGVMRGMARSMTAPAGFTGSVRARLADVRPRRFSVPSAGWRKGFAAAAALLVVASASIGLACGLLPLTRGTVALNAGKNSPGVSVPAAPVPGSREPREGFTPPAGEEKPGELSPDRGTSPEMTEAIPGPAETTPETTEKVRETKETAASPPAGQPEVKKPVEPRQVATATVPGRPAEPKAFLDKERKITSTLLKVAVGDLPAATEEALALAGKAGAEYQALAVQSAGDRQIKIIRFTAPKDNELPARLAGLGTVLDRQSEVQDVTGRFTATLEKYRELLAQRDSAGNGRQQEELRARATALEQQLNAWDREAEKQVITLWLEAK